MTSISSPVSPSNSGMSAIMLSHSKPQRICLHLKVCLPAIRSRATLAQVAQGVREAKTIEGLIQSLKESVCTRGTCSAGKVHILSASPQATNAAANLRLARNGSAQRWRQGLGCRHTQARPDLASLWTFGHPQLRL